MKQKEEMEIGRGELNTMIGKGSTIQGDLNVQNSLRVDGAITGNIRSSDTVIVGREGRVKGEIRAKNVMLSGQVEGHIVAEGKVFLDAKASVKGDIQAVRLVVDDGAVFDGQCVMTGKDKAASNVKT